MYHVIKRVSQGMAILGGIMLGLLILLICVSIAGRLLNGALHSDAIMARFPELATWLLNTGIGPVNGDFELVEVGVAFAIFAFMPFCHATGGHATVDIFTSMLPSAVVRVLVAVIDVVFAAAFIVLAVQLESGLETKLRSGETTFLLQFPVWWGYALSLFAAVVSALVSTGIAILRIVEIATSQRLIIDDLGAEH